MRRVRCEVSAVELEGNYTTVEGVCATCSRCGHSTEAYGTSAPSVRRCLAMLREECPHAERNYYIAADAETARRSAVEAAYDSGYADGMRDGRRQAPVLDLKLLRSLVALCHPDRHPPERAEAANRATASLLELLEREREAA